MVSYYYAWVYLAKLNNNMTKLLLLSLLTESMKKTDWMVVSNAHKQKYKSYKFMPSLSWYAVHMCFDF